MIFTKRFLAFELKGVTFTNFRLTLVIAWVDLQMYYKVFKVLLKKLCDTLQTVLTVLLNECVCLTNR
jgi:hypothetical protein